mmetsp:Transcript_13369/g.33933  ORF Transcript_13369/g.33933 Transcript_13369/m.33933 type:complete len:223 (-) Transcript_13369:816-1484(-)
MLGRDFEKLGFTESGFSSSNLSQNSSSSKGKASSSSRTSVSSASVSLFTTGRADCLTAGFILDSLIKTASSSSKLKPASSGPKSSSFHAEGGFSWRISSSSEGTRRPEPPRLGSNSVSSSSKSSRSSQLDMAPFSALERSNAPLGGTVLSGVTFCFFERPKSREERGGAVTGVRSASDSDDDNPFNRLSSSMPALLSLTQSADGSSSRKSSSSSKSSSSFLF